MVGLWFILYRYTDLRVSKKIEGFILFKRGPEFTLGGLERNTANLFGLKFELTFKCNCSTSTSTSTSGALSFSKAHKVPFFNGYMMIEISRPTEIYSLSSSLFCREGYIFFLSPSPSLFLIF